MTEAVTVEEGQFARYGRLRAESKARYEEAVLRVQQNIATRKDEGHRFFRSGLVTTRHKETGMPTGYFNTNALYTFAGLPNFSGGTFSSEQLIREVKEFLSQNPSKKVLMVDAFGQGVVGDDIAREVELLYGKISAKDGRLHTIATTLFKSDITPRTVTEISGDALSELVSRNLLDTVREKKSEGYALRYTFFRPVLGLEKHDRNIYVLETLYKNLCDLYAEHDNGGYIFIQSITSGALDIDLLKEVLAPFQDRQLYVLDSAQIPRAMVIRKNPSVPKLPDFRDIIRHNPELLGRLIRIAENGNH